ncbi:Tyrosine recombinase XerD [Bacillus subtilis]|nr:Tyrosine recombinase XerD [Bacillus subtilis]
MLILDDIGTHTLRKTFGYHFYKQTKDVAMLQEIFNHSDQRTTLRYIRINQDAMNNAMKKFKI